MHSFISSRDQGIIDRVKAARKAAGLKRWAVAAALGIPAAEYSSYERQIALPFQYLLVFAILVRCEPGYIVTGRLGARSEAEADTNIVCPINRCGKPCHLGKFWCDPKCSDSLQIKLGQ